MAKGRLRRLHRGVYAVGRPQLGEHGRLMAAVLASGPGAVLSYESAAVLWGMLDPRPGPVHVSIPSPAPRRPEGVIVHRRPSLRRADVTVHERIPVTSPACTLVDLATRLSRSSLERAINEADKRDRIGVEELRACLEGFQRVPGVAALRTTLDRRTFVLTDSELERRFLPIARRAGLGRPETGRRVNGYRVDFHWPHLGLVVETDGLRYHRTPAQQARDRERDQAHLAAGLTPLRFTHAQVRFEPGRVAATLGTVVCRLRSGA